MKYANIEEYNLTHYNFFADVAKDLNCTIKSLSNNYIFEVFSIDKNKKFYIINNALPLNSNTSQKACADKCATSIILTQNKVDCVEHMLLKNPNVIKNWDKQALQNLIDEYKTVVVKDNSGSCGLMVYRAKNVKEIQKYANQIFKNGKDVAVCPYINYENEYRLIMLNHKCEICFKKIRPFVEGDGKSNIKSLVLNKYGKEALDILEDINANQKPKEKEVVTVGWKSNLEMFSTPEDITDKTLKKTLETLAKKCTKALGTTFCSVDIIDDNGIFKVLEVNSIVSVQKYAGYSAENYKKAKLMFKKAFLQQLSQ